MTSLTDRFADIESDRFSAAVNVANNLKTFLRAARVGAVGADSSGDG
jgi:hypothetical protein